MFNLFRKKKDSAAAASLSVTTDIHSHILPGIDDGSPDIPTSIKLVKGLYNLGYRKLVATPHIIGDFYRNTPLIINDQLKKLKEACAVAGIDIELSAAAEYMLDDYFLDLLKKERLLTINENLLLTELPYSVPATNVEETVFAIITGGYKPILAHPERYFYYHKNYSEYHKLKELGFSLQVNLLSITGYYGTAVAKAAKYIFDNDLADFVGTDMHHVRHLDAFQNKRNIITINESLSGNKRKFNFVIT